MGRLVDADDLLETLRELREFYRKRYDKYQVSYDRGAYEALDDVKEVVEEMLE